MTCVSPTIISSLSHTLSSLLIENHDYKSKKKNFTNSKIDLNRLISYKLYLRGSRFKMWYKTYALSLLPSRKPRNNKKIMSSLKKLLI